jgi:hypothetical protein
MKYMLFLMASLRWKNGVEKENIPEGLKSAETMTTSFSVTERSGSGIFRMRAETVAG